MAEGRVYSKCARTSYKRVRDKWEKKGGWRRSELAAFCLYLTSPKVTLHWCSGEALVNNGFDPPLPVVPPPFPSPTFCLPLPLEWNRKRVGERELRNTGRNGKPRDGGEHALLPLHPANNGLFMWPIPLPPPQRQSHKHESRSVRLGCVWYKPVRGGLRNERALRPCVPR